MGFFNFLYKLSNICTNKKKLKFFIVVGLIILFVFALHTKGYCAPTASDGLALRDYQLALQQSFISRLKYLYQNKPYGWDAQAFNDTLNNMKSSYFWVQPASAENNVDFNVYFYYPNYNSIGNSANIFTIEADWSCGLNSGTTYPCYVGDVTFHHMAKIYMVVVSNPKNIVVSGGGSTYMPSDFYMIRSIEVDNFLQEMGLYSNLETTFSTSDEELQSITSSGFANLNSSINNQTTQMTNSINSASSSITNSIDSVENTLTDTTTDDTQVTFVEDNNEDLTYNFFSNLFSQYTDTFTRPQVRVLRIKFPFTEKYLTLNNYYFQNNILSDSKYTNLVALIHSFWWFCLGMYVLLDVYHKINKIKSGDLTNIENENITTELL